MGFLCVPGTSMLPRLGDKLLVPGYSNFVWQILLIRCLRLLNRFLVLVTLCFGFYYSGLPAFPPSAVPGFSNKPKRKIISHPTHQPMQFWTMLFLVGLRNLQLRLPSTFHKSLPAMVFGFFCYRIVLASNLKPAFEYSNATTATNK